MANVDTFLSRRIYLECSKFAMVCINGMWYYIEIMYHFMNSRFLFWCYFQWMFKATRIIANSVLFFCSEAIFLIFCLYTVDSRLPVLRIINKLPVLSFFFFSFFFHLDLCPFLTTLRITGGIRLPWVLCN